MTTGNPVRSSGISFPFPGVTSLDGVVTFNSITKGLKRSMESLYNIVNNMQVLMYMHVAIIYPDVGCEYNA